MHGECQFGEVWPGVTGRSQSAEASEETGSSLRGCSFRPKFISAGGLGYLPSLPTVCFILFQRACSFPGCWVFSILPQKGYAGKGTCRSLNILWLESEEGSS